MRKVIVCDYNSEWNTLYQKEKRLLIETPGDVVKKIHHIASTLVKGLSAKLIIEILTSVKRIL